MFFIEIWRLSSNGKTYACEVYNERSLLSSLPTGIRKMANPLVLGIRETQINTEIPEKGIIDMSTIKDIKKDIQTIDFAHATKKEVNSFFIKVVEHKNPRRVFDILFESGIIDIILPEFVLLKGCEQSPIWHVGDVYEHTMLVLEHLKSKSLEVKLSGMFHDIGKPDTFSQDEDGRIRNKGHEHIGAEKARAILFRLGFNENVISLVCNVIKYHKMPFRIQERRRSKVEKLLSFSFVDQLLELVKADVAGSGKNYSDYNFLITELKKFRGRVIFEPLINGYDLLNMKYTPGPLFGKILRFIAKNQKSGIIETKEEALKLVADNFKRDRK